MFKSPFTALALALGLAWGGPRETPRQTAKRRLKEAKAVDEEAIQAAEAKRERRRLRNIQNQV